MLNKIIYCLVISAALVGCALLSRPLQAASLWGGGVELGFPKTTSNDQRELNRRGDCEAVLLGASYFLQILDRGVFSPMIGVQRFSLQGDDPARRQKIEVMTTIFELDYRWIQGSGFEPGLMLRGNYGDTSSLLVEDKDKSKLTINVGLQAAYRFVGDPNDVLVYAAATRDLSVERQVNTQFLFGLQYWWMPVEKEGI